MAASPGNTYVALLRGINVGGNNKLPMRDLVTIFEKAGCRNVRTYIQSGNVVFQSDVFQSDEASRLAETISQAIERNFTLRIPVILRTAEEMTSALHNNPFAVAGVAEDYLHVFFLVHRPTAAAIAALDVSRSFGDTFAVAGREIYLHLPGDVARTKLTNVYFDRALSTVSTLRNWRTVRLLADACSPK